MAIIKKEEVTSTYIHIPFCKTICSYCDFCKMFYNSAYVEKYLIALEKEIANYYQGEEQKTIYIGGGTPTSLNLQELEKLFIILNRLKKSETIEFTIEANIDSLNEEKIKLFKKYGINRVSIGIETINQNNLNFLNRTGTKEEIENKISLLKKEGIENINLDFIYAIPKETIKEVEEDLAFFLSLNVPHISTYSLILEEHTKLYIDGVKEIDEELDLKMYELLTRTLKAHGYVSYEFSNFAKDGFMSKHNLVYWNNKPYYGFGLGASGFLNLVRYTNTRSLTNYCKGNTRLEEEVMTKEKNMENELIVGFRMKSGVNKVTFLEKYEVRMEEIFPIEELKRKGYLEEIGDSIRIPEDKWYLSNEILIEFIKE